MELNVIRLYERLSFIDLHNEEKKNTHVNEYKTKFVVHLR